MSVSCVDVATDGEKQDRMTDEDLPDWLTDLVNAGRDMAGVLEEYIQSCGNSPPHPDNCEDCRDAQNSIQRWAVAVWTARRNFERAK